jgi:hypothetical protein
MLVDTKGNPISSAPPPPPPPMPIVKFLSMEEVRGYLGSEKHLNFGLIREGCRIMGISFTGGGTMFCNKGPEEEEFVNLTRALSAELRPNVHYIVAYERLPRQHAYLTYYSVIAIQSEDMLDLKKAFKIQKLKAFL